MTLKEFKHGVKSWFIGFGWFIVSILVMAILIFIISYRMGVEADFKAEKYIYK